LRRSFGRLPFTFSNQQSGDNSVSLTPYDFKDSQQPDDNLENDDLYEHSKTSKMGGNLLQVRITMEYREANTKSYIHAQTE